MEDFLPPPPRGRRGRVPTGRALPPRQGGCRRPTSPQGCARCQACSGTGCLRAIGSRRTIGWRGRRCTSFAPALRRGLMAPLVLPSGRGRGPLQDRRGPDRGSRNIIGSGARSSCVEQALFVGDDADGLDGDAGHGARASAGRRPVRAERSGSTPWTVSTGVRPLEGRQAGGAARAPAPASPRSWCGRRWPPRLAWRHPHGGAGPGPEHALLHGPGLVAVAGARRTSSACRINGCRSGSHDAVGVKRLARFVTLSVRGRTPSPSPPFAPAGPGRCRRGRRAPRPTGRRVRKARCTRPSGRVGRPAGTRSRGSTRASPRGRRPPATGDVEVDVTPSCGFQQHASDPTRPAMLTSFAAATVAQDARAASSRTSPASRSPRCRRRGRTGSPRIWPSTQQPRTSV